MHTIIEIDLIAKRANERIAKEFAELGFSNPPVVTHGIVRAVLQAAEQSVHWTGGDSIGFCELHQISFLQAECPRCHPASQ